MLASRQLIPSTKPPTLNGVSPSCIFLPKGQWATCEDFLAERFPAVSPIEWQQRILQKRVLDAGGKSIQLGQPYQHGNLLYYYRNLPAETFIPFTETIIYQDEWIVVADKPHFLPVIPSGRYLQETLLVRLKRRLNIETLSPAHRIDRETAGLVIFTIKPETRALYQECFRHHRVEKHYEAVAPHKPDLSLPAVHRSCLIQSEASFMKMKEAEGTPNAETEIRLIAARGTLARYALKPLTGKKHQLRVQMAGLGIPILNDRIYPHLLPEETDAENHAKIFTRPLQLLAKRISFEDPITRQQRYFESHRQLRL